MIYFLKKRSDILRKIAPEERLNMRKTYAGKIINVVRTQGFLSFTIQDIAKLMNISRASLYNYFSSKEDIIMEMTDLYIDYINEADKTISNEDLSYQLRLLKVFEQAVLSAIYASDIYLNDLKTSCTVLYEKKMLSKRDRLASLYMFYQNGIDAGVFNTLNPTILVMQDEVVLLKLFNSSFLIEEGLSLKQALYDYYEAKKIQVLKPEYFNSEENAGIDCVIDHILQKISAT